MPPASLSIEERRGPDRVVLTLAGEIDIATVGDLRGVVRSSAGNGAGRVILDFGGVTFCDSQGLSALIALTRELDGNGTQLVLSNLGDFMLQLFDVTGLRAALTIDDSVTGQPNSAD